MNEPWSKHKEFAVMVLDIENAYDGVSHKGLHQVMLKRGFPTKLDYITASIEINKYDSW